MLNVLGFPRAQRPRGALAAALLSALVSCSSDPSAEGAESAQPPPEVASTSAALGTPGFIPIPPCLKESDYVSRASVNFFWDGVYKPRCLRLASGGTVVFQGMFELHPLEPRAGGSTPSPIVPTNSGGWAEFEFPDHGLYPYRDAAHPEEMGVIWSGYY
jgi:hypothetical protein